MNLQSRKVLSSCVLWQAAPHTTRLIQNGRWTDLGVIDKARAESIARKHGVQFAELSANSRPVLVACYDDGE